MSCYAIPEPADSGTREQCRRGKDGAGNGRLVTNVPRLTLCVMGIVLAKLVLLHL